MTPKRNGRLAGLGAALAAVPLLAALGGCGIDTSSSVSGPPAPGPVVVGAPDTVEGELLARLYAGALEASGRGTELALGLGDRAERLAALDANRVALVPEYTGRLLHWFDPDAEVTEEEAVFEALTMALPTGFALSEYAPADDRSVLVLSAEEADRAGIGTVGELAPACGGLTLFASDAFDEDAGALTRLESVHDCAFRGVVPVPSAADVVQDVVADATVVGGATAAAPQVGQDDVVMLEDADAVFTAQNVVPLYRSDALRADDVRALSVVLQLTTEDLADLADRIRSGELTSAEAADGWLDEHL